MRRLGLIGCGEIASTQHVPAVLRNPDTELVVVCDTDPLRARSVAALSGVSSWTSRSEELWNQALDGLILATPPSATPRLAAQALRRGIPVLCEKPIAVDLASAQELVDVQASTGTPCQVGYKNRFAPAILHLKTWLDALETRHGLLSRIHSFDEIWNAGEVDEEFVVRTKQTLGLGDPIVHEGTHHLDLLTWLVGPIDSLISSVRLHIPSGEALEPHYNGAYLRLANGGIALIETGWCFPHSIKGEIQIWAPNGFAEVSRSRSTVTISRDGQELIESFDYDWQAAAFDGQLQAFLDIIDGKEQVGATVPEAFDVLRIALSITNAAGSTPD